MVKMTSWRLMSIFAASKHTVRNGCFIFANFSQIPTSTSNLSVSLESQWNVDSNDTLCVRKYCQLFTYELDTFLCKNTSLKPMGANSRKPPLSLAAHGLLPNTAIPEPTPLTNPNNSTIGTRLLHNYATKFPLVTSNSHPKLPAPLQL